MRATLLALLFLFCAHAAAAQGASDFDWATAVIHYVDAHAIDSEGGTSSSSAGDLFASYPPESTIAVAFRPHMDDLIKAARDASLHVVARVDGASTSAESAAKALEAGLAGFIVDGNATTLRSKLSAHLEPDLPLRIASSSDGTPALLEPRREVIQPNTDWDALFAAADRGMITLIQVDAWSEHVLRMLLLMPGGLYIEGPLGETASKIAAFRLRHPAVGAGLHERLINAAYTFRRSIEGVDEAVIVIGAEDRIAINVSRVFADDTLLQDAVTGATAFVSFGMATFEADPSGIILIEEMP